MKQTLSPADRLSAVIRVLYSDHRVSERWPGLRIVKDDGLSVFRSGEPLDRFYFVARHDPSGETREVYISAQLAYVGSREDLFKLETLVEKRLGEFWDEMNPDWPGLGPAGAK